MRALEIDLAAFKNPKTAIDATAATAPFVPNSGGLESVVFGLSWLEWFQVLSAMWIAAQLLKLLGAGHLIKYLWSKRSK